jgi:hypothetical protein
MDAHLNALGKEKWGQIFPDGVIPVLDITPKEAETEDNQALEVYIVAWDSLTQVQRGQIINKLSVMWKASTQDIENDILDKGLPLQSKYVSSVSIPMRFLI